MTNHTAIINATLQRHYGVSYAGAYARCLDAGMKKENAESEILSLVQTLSLGHEAGENRAHSVLSHPAGKAAARA